jgi:hypothetical protein
MTLSVRQWPNLKVSCSQMFTSCRESPPLEFVRRPFALNPRPSAYASVGHKIISRLPGIASECTWTVFARLAVPILYPNRRLTQVEARIVFERKPN